MEMGSEWAQSSSVGDDVKRREGMEAEKEEALATKYSTQ